MTNENQSVKNMISGSSTKQKVVTIATVIVFIIIIWQVIGLFSNKTPATSPVAAIKPAPTKQMSSTAPGTMASTTPGTSQMNPAVVGTNAPTQMPTVPIISTSKETSSLLKDQETEQKNYLDSLNQLQMLKVKREIAETNQAISSARLATATADKSMSDLLTAPAAPAVNPGFTTTTTNIDSSQATGSPPPPFEEPAKPAPVVVEAAYTVISVSMQFQRWTAVLGLDGKLYSVGVGDTLVDGSSVVSISRGGVVLEKGNKRRKISLVNSI